MPIECAQGDRPARCPNHFFAVNEPSAVPWWWCDLFWCHEVACGVRWSNVLGCEVTWVELLWLVATWHVMLCHLMCWSCHLVRCAGHVMSLDVLQSTTPVLLQTYSNTTLYYKVLLQYYSDYQVLRQYYSVLQSTTPVQQSTTPVLLWLPSSAPVLLCTTLYYKVLRQYYSVLQSTTPVLQSTTPVPQKTTPILLRTTKDYSSTTLYYKVLLQYYSVLQSTTPVLLCTTKYYSSTTPYCKVLLCTTKCYSSTTLYYKVLLQYYSVLQSTTPVLLGTTKYYSSTTLYYKVLLQYYSSTTKYYSSTTLYYKVLLRYYFETSFTMRRARVITLQPHQILRLPRKMNLMIDPHHIWNVMYNARSNRHHPPTSPNTAPATQNECHDWSASHMQRHLQCAEQEASPSNLTKYCTCHAKWISWLIVLTYETSFPMRKATGINFQPHQILRLPRKMSTQHLTEICWKQVQRHFQCATDPRPIRDRSETVPSISDHDPTQKTQTATRRAAKATFRTRQEQIPLKITTFPAPAIIPNFTKCCACHEKWHMNFTKCCTCHKKWHMNFTKCCTCHKKWHMIFTKCCTCHKKWHEVTHDYYHYYY